MTRPLDVAAADAYCWRLACRHYENFTVASRLLRRGLRRDLARVYAYCRSTDDLGDEHGVEARVHLERWREEVVELFAGGRPTHPVLVALRDTVQHYQLPAQPFLDLIQANLQDQVVSSYAAWPELRAYCDKSAAPVGRIVLRLFRIRTPAAEPLSDDVCIGLQLANFAQDVSVDAAKGRTYLLQTDLQAGGITGATRGLCERARTLLASGRELEGLAPWPLRFQLALYRLGGLAIVDAIERLGYRTDLRRPQVSPWAKLLVLQHAVRQSILEVGSARRLGTA
ncbi:MAG TPA: squalene/phytoene synthase family protein [bacterium]|nr:squalene/phytoene synthase family protein [bacterium]